MTLSCVLTRHQRSLSLPEIKDPLTNAVKPCTHMMWTMAPQPLRASRSMALRKVCETVSNRSSGSRSGSHSPSATPYSLSAAVPATAKSFGVVIHPILSRQHSSGQLCAQSSRVHGRDERLGMRLELGWWCQTGDDRLDEEWSES